ncbi:hypothetical protein GEMRC1_006138 [Eukaryota sp. GEM-RC1]
MRISITEGFQDFNFLSLYSTIFSETNPLVINVFSCTNSFTSFCEFFAESNIKALDITFHYPSSSQLFSFSTILPGNTNLDKISISNKLNNSNNAAMIDDILVATFQVLSTSMIKEIDLSNLSISYTRVLSPLLKRGSCKVLVLPKVDILDGSALTLLQHNSSLVEVTLNNSNFDAESLSQVLQFNTILKKLTLLRCCCSFSPIFEALKSNTSLSEFNILDVNRIPFENQEVKLFQEMVHSNNTLKTLTIDGSMFNPLQFTSILNSLENNSCLNTVSIPNLDLSCLILVYESLFSQQFYSVIRVPPHHLDTGAGVIYYSPLKPSKITLEQISSLKLLFKKYSIKKLSLKKCRFTNEGVTALCDLMRVNNSLTSVDFSDCALCDDNIVDLIDCFRRSQKYSYLFELLHSSIFQKSIPNIRFEPHFVDVSLGLIRFEDTCEDNDLIALLNAVKSNIPINRIDCRGLSSISLDALIASYEILSINPNLLDLDVSPHFFNIDEGMFLYSPDELSQITTNQLSSLSRLCQSCHVMELSLQRSFLSFEAVSSLSNLLRVNDSLTYLDLSHCRTSSGGIIRIFESLQSNLASKIKNMTLFSCNIDHNIAVLLSEALKVNSSVSDINLGCNSVGDQGAMALAETLKVNSSLNTVNLWSNSIGDEGAIAMAEALKTNCSLSDLNLGANLIGEPGARALLDALKFNSTIDEISLLRNSVGNLRQESDNRITF